PTAALVNLPEQLTGAWGTEQKTRVSGTALVEADALPEAEVEPLGVGGWVKRVALWGGIPILCVLAWLGINKLNTVKEQRDDIRELRAYVDPELKVPKFHAAELYRTIGKLELRKDKGKADDARVAFVAARTLVLRAEDAEPFERDLVLSDIALSQLGLAGVE